MSSWRVREASFGDVPMIAEIGMDLVRIHSEEFPARFFPPDAGAIATLLREKIESPDTRVLVVEADDCIVGYAYVSVIDKPASPFSRARKHLEIEHLAIAESARRRGYGEALVARIDELRKELQAAEVTLNVWTFNEPARRLYEKLGFTTLRYVLTRNP